jgi:hypothetical protein
LACATGANCIADTAVRRIPSDDKLFAIKGPTSLTNSTVRGRVLVPFDMLGYVSGSEQAIREIDAGANEARYAPRKSRAEEFAVAAAIMVAIGSIELLTMIGLSISQL